MKTLAASVSVLSNSLSTPLPCPSSPREGGDLRDHSPHIAISAPHGPTWHSSQAGRRHPVHKPHRGFRQASYSLFTENENENPEDEPASTEEGSRLQKLPCIPPDKVHVSQDSPMPGIPAWGHIPGVPKNVYQLTLWSTLLKQ